MSAVSQTEFDDVSTEAAVNDDAVESVEPRAALSSSDDMVAIADTSRRLADLARRVAVSDCTVLIAGERVSSIVIRPAPARPSWR